MKYYGVGVLSSVASAAAIAQSVVVQVGVNNLPLPPFIMGEGDEFPDRPGLSVELVRQAAKACKVDIKLKRLPSQRLLQEIKSGEIDAVIQLSYSPERAEYAAFPMIDNKVDGKARLTTLTYCFYVDAKRPIQWDGKKLSNTNLPVGAIYGWSVIQDLEKLKINFETAPDFKSNIAKLRANRIAAFAAQSALVEAYLGSDKSIVALSPPIAEKDYFLPFSLPFAQKYPEAKQCLWKHISQMRDEVFLQRASAYDQWLLH
ncbi:transporter substrate-binding domain-containing protein [Leeia sp. TBRC 13508]|uniref:Transporter substrate-binding domain-containing protein n=1 Tax=Leeia speluncae TaxID=2884804 RepID=A0ABS8DAE6_9NEIS|nr:transporter substrate-binding domain-containing protein [Leeia speluncae]MCB6185183.1 transporter substrate-binding domain-containing protein [Leeia speluncae]